MATAKTQTPKRIKAFGLGSSNLKKPQRFFFSSVKSLCFEVVQVPSDNTQTTFPFKTTTKISAKVKSNKTAFF